MPNIEISEDTLERLNFVLHHENNTFMDDLDDVIIALLDECDMGELLPDND